VRYGSSSIRETYCVGKVLIALIRAYQRYVSPVLGAHCRFSPTCSQYAIDAIRRHGWITGSGYALWRIARCQPLCKGGYDPVPRRGDVRA